MKISVVIVTHNRCAELRKSLQDLRKQTQAPYEVLAVDNASTDDTVKMLEEDFPDIRLIKSKTNLGIPAGRNLGYAESGGDICLTLDDDAFLRPRDALERIERYFKSDKKLCCLSFQVMDGEGTKVARHYIPRRDRRIVKEDSLGASFVGTGHALHRQIFLELGGFWEDLGLYFGEEPDLSYRIIDAGYHIIHTPNISVLHYESETARPSGRRLYHGVRNTPWIALKNLPWYSVVTLTTLAWGYYFLQSIRYGLFKDYVLGVRDSIKGWRKVLKQRRRVSSETVRYLKEHSGVLWY